MTPTDSGGPAAFYRDEGAVPIVGFLGFECEYLAFDPGRIGFVGAEHGGSLAPVRTAPVVLRKITLTGSSIHMVVASTEGDVLFDGRLSANGDLMCGTVSYHDGETFPMLAQKRPSTYQSQSQAQRAR